MSERILKALMQLFAIIARVDNYSKEGDGKIDSSFGRNIVSVFLKTELNSKQVKEYLNMFDEFLILHHTNTSKKDGEKKRTSVNSVKVLKICSQINKELTQRQKIIVLVRILEFIKVNDVVTEQELEFVNTVSESFNIPNEEFENLKSHLNSGEEIEIDSPDFLYIHPKKECAFQGLHAELEGLNGLIRFVYIRSTNMLFFRYFGNDELNMNGQILSNDRNHIFNHGSSLRTVKSAPIYYSDIISKFLNLGSSEKLIFKAENVVYRFQNKKIGLHTLNFTQESGKLVGIMGGSGSGKSTFLNVMNGNLQPSSGTVYVNQYNLHSDIDQLRGIIGYVSQDDILIEDLSVFDNLFFNAKLCFKNLSDNQLKKKVLELLSMIGLQEVMHLKVGSIMDKTISGGQRKRLNIALELIRKPAILFVDEPTSGLSSRDSENIMDLLKELASRGNLVFVVIHQPSSEIFKMFDRLLLLDTGGYMIFDGNPLDAVVHFKACINHVNANQAECGSCGNVNPEQIFNIIESKVVDEFGNNTDTRKKSPEEWHQLYLDYYTEKETEIPDTLPESSSKAPSLLTQFNVFFKRDVLSKLANKQYIFMNLFEAPLLALILSFFVKFFTKYGENSGVYIFSENENLPQYLFIAVVVSLFLGLTVTAEEIIKDRKIVKRESFLNLSKTSYLLSKVSIMFILSAIQTLTFVLIGNYVLEIENMTWYYWLILFSTACSANMIGLNVSSAFKSEKVIYITVPILIIPQLLFSGVIVKFDKLHPVFSTSNEVPFIGDIMVSRWAYEALVTTQFTENNYQKKVYQFELNKSQSAWKKDYWLPEMEMLNEVVLTPSDSKSFAENKEILLNELRKEEVKWANISCESCVKTLSSLKFNDKNEVLFNTISYYLTTLKKQYNHVYETNADAIDELTTRMGVKQMKALKQKYENTSLTNLVRNRDELSKIIRLKGNLVQKTDPIYLYPTGKTTFKSHFYASEKKLFGKKMSTRNFNLIIIWLFTFVLFFVLRFELLRKLLEINSKKF
jgi:ABC transport system ATP-binding/permease protein